MAAWTAADVPDQAGRTIVITGANSGLGQVAALELARHGAAVTLAVRNTASGQATAHLIRQAVPGARVAVRMLDLSSLDSVRAFAAQVAEELPLIDVLINNAGTMRGPRRTTQDGFELQLGTNYLGHFALTGLLLPLLACGTEARVVTLSSTEHKPGHLDFDDLMATRSYDSRRAYQQSKLANTVFGIELDRRLRAVGSPIISVLAHPGVSKSNLATNGATAIERLTVRVITALIAQPTARGALPELYAATAPGIRGGQFFGPTGFQEMRGPVGPVGASGEASDPAVGARLWATSADLTGVRYLDAARTAGADVTAPAPQAAATVNLAD